MGTLAVKRVEYGSGEKLFSQGKNDRASSLLITNKSTGKPSSTFGLHYTTTRDAIAEYDGEDLKNRIVETMLATKDYDPAEGFDPNLIYNFSTYFYYPVNIYGDRCVLNVSKGGSIKIGDGCSLDMLPGSTINLGDISIGGDSLANGSIGWEKLDPALQAKIDGKINIAGKRGQVAGYNGISTVSTSAVSINADSNDDIVATAKVSAFNINLSSISGDFSSTKTVYLTKGIDTSLQFNMTAAKFYWVQGSIPNVVAGKRAVLVLKLFKNGSEGTVIGNIMSLPN